MTYRVPDEQVQALGAHLVALGLAEPTPGYGHATGTQVAEAVFAWLHADESAEPAAPVASGERFDFDGHMVTSVEQGVAAVISHHVTPVIGWIRLADSHGETIKGDPLSDAFKKAATVIVTTLNATPATLTVPTPASVSEQERENLRRALTIARHDSFCSPRCGDDISTYPWVSDGEVDAAVTWANTRTTTPPDGITETETPRG